jgi:polar amino acid transport system substrate-binding protein
MKSSSKSTNIILIVIAALLLLSAIVIGCTVLKPTLTPEEPMPTTTIPPPIAVDATWERIKASGKLVVGTSADYPPFEFYNTQYQLDGFDIALIRAIGIQLGLQVEISDFAFDGLGSALQIGQIDAAIAAISATEERSQYADFSNVYYVAEEALLANQSSPINSITSIDQVVSQRVGVQNKSVYQAWFQKNQVDTGKMPASNLLVYPRMDSAINELKAGRIDLVALDKPAADQYLLTGGMKLVESGHFQQLYSIAAIKGSSTLISELNRALVELNNQGTINQLAQQYLGLPPNTDLPTPAPTPTIPPNQPTSTPVPQPACSDGVKFIKDLNYPDYDMKNPPVLPAGQAFKKGWRLQNTGTCTWTSSYYLSFAKGNVSAARMGGQPTAIIGSVPPNATYDIYVDLVAPIQPGIYQGYWTMNNPKNVPFGKYIWVGIQVTSGPTVTPVITVTPSPNMAFKSDKTMINAGEAVTFSWSVQSAREVYFYAQGERWQDNKVKADGSRTVHPPQTTIYELKAVYNDGTTEKRQIRIEVVQPAPEAPDIKVFKVYPKQVDLGGTVTIEWEVQGDVDKVTIFKGNVPMQEDTSMNGVTTDNPTEVGWVAYSITVWWPGGDPISWQEDVEIVQPVPDAPVITVFKVYPKQINLTDPVTIEWDVQGDVEKVTLYKGNAPLQDDASASGVTTDTPTEVGWVTFSITVWWSGGDPVSWQEDVQVADLEPQPPIVTVEPPTPEEPSPKEPTPTPPAVIEYFNALPEQIQIGSCIDLSWKVTGGVEQVQILRNDIPIPTDGSFTGSGQDCQAPEGTVVYVLEAINADGQAEYWQTVVEVLPAQVADPLVGSSWRLVSLSDGAGLVIPVQDGTIITAVFQPGYMLSGSAALTTITLPTRRKIM